MTGAFRHITGKGYRQVIMVSDGLPDNQKSALEAAKQVGCPIGIVFLGDDPEGREFMEKLAQLTGGKSANIREKDFSQRQLTATVRLLLTA